MKTCASLARTALIVAIAAVLLAGTNVIAQQKDGKGAATDARAAELMKMALQQLGTTPGQQQAEASQAPAVDLRIEEAVQHAMDNNIDLGVQKLNPQLQDLALASVRGAYRPTVGGTFATNSLTTIPSDTLSGGSIVTTDTYTYNANVSQMLPWTGGTVLFQFNNSRRLEDSNKYSINPSYNAAFQLQLSQSLWRNFLIDSTRQSLWTGIISRQIADVTLRASVLNTAANTRNAYWDLVYAIQNVEVAKQSLALAEKLVQDNQARVEVGTLAPLDVITAQSQAATARRTLVQAQQTRTQNELALKRLIVSSTSDPLWTATINPVDRPDPEIAPMPIDIQAAIRNALDKRTDLVTARQNLKSSDITLKYNKNQTLPAADLTAYYGASGTAGNIYRRYDPITGAPCQIGCVPVLMAAGGYGDAFQIMQNRQAPTWNFQIRFSYPIGTSAADANLARAKVQYQQAQANLKASELSVATQVTQAALNVTSSLEQVQAARVARELAQKKLEAEQSKFEVGMQTSYFVVQAQNDLLNAQTAELQAIASYRKNLVTFQLVQEAPASSGTGGGTGTVTATGSGSTGSSSTGGSSGGGPTGGQ